jgi:hypothetical protein
MYGMLSFSALIVSMNLFCKDPSVLNIFFNVYGFVEVVTQQPKPTTSQDAVPENQIFYKAEEPAVPVLFYYIMLRFHLSKLGIR